MSAFITTLPLLVGKDLIEASIFELHNGYETYYELTIPSIGFDKSYQLYLEPYGDVYFYFLKSTPEEIRCYEECISKTIFNYCY